MDPKPDHHLKPLAIWNNLHLVWRRSELRDLAFAMFCFVGLQGPFGSYFVTVVSQHLGKPPSVANHLFSLAMSAAVFARIPWGWAGSRVVSARMLLGTLALIMVIASVAVRCYDSSWSILMIPRHAGTA